MHLAQSWTWTYAAKEAFPTPKGEAVAEAKLNHLLLATISNPICEHFRGADSGGEMSRVRQAVTLTGRSYIKLCFNHLRNQLFRRHPGVRWNFSLMRKYPAELQAYGVLN